MGKICDPPPFSGGQCPVAYLVDIDVAAFNANGDPLFAPIKHRDILVFGPLDNIRVFQNGMTFQGRVRNGVRLGWFDVPTYGYSVEQFFQSHFTFFPGVFVQFSNLSFRRTDSQFDNCGDPPPINCRCSEDSCRVDCATAPDGFCCIDHSLTNQLLQTLQG